jgi:hypothetical protein
LPNVSGWPDFKSFVNTLDYPKFMFRGQDCTKRLRTRYHRTGRADIERYRQRDIPSLHRRLSAITGHLFDLTKYDEYGSFLGLAQHHGYPTPLLDWTLSPYIAAFFAYRAIDRAFARSPEAANEKVRIFVFDQSVWHQQIPRVRSLRPYGPSFSILELLPIDNPRMIPQQSITTLTNVDDIEWVIRAMETQHGRQYLQAIDLPVSARDEVMRELAIMGITAGSMFPSLDGACEELRERMFA